MAVLNSVPTRDELEATFKLSPGLAQALGEAKRAELVRLSAERSECIRSADFLIVKVMRARVQKQPGSKLMRDEAAGMFREYTQRHAGHATAATVKAWLEAL
jgi:hypothetical protein